MKRRAAYACLFAPFAILFFAASLSGLWLGAQEITGVWQGTREGAAKQRCVVKIAKAADGQLGAEVYLIDDAPDGHRADTVTFADRVLTIKFTSAAVSYTGTLSEDGQRLVGKFTMSGTNELDLNRVTAATAWPLDPTPHTVQFVEVEPGVRLETLDWGGSGRPVVLLSGLGDSAHVFDRLAPKLTGRYHVYGITRRGFGASDTPPATEGAYGPERLGDDVVAVMDKLKLVRPVVIGHSIAGEELSSIADRHPEKVAGLVYLDAGFQFALYVPGQEHYLIDWNGMRKAVEAIEDARTPQQQKLLIAEMLKTELPQYEAGLAERQKDLAAMPDAPTPPETRDRESIARDAIFHEERRYTEIKVPVLAIFAYPPAGKRTAEEQAKRTHVFDVQSAAWEALGQNVRVVRIRDADHYVFRSNQAEVLAAISSFIETLPR